MTAARPEIRLDINPMNREGFSITLPVTGNRYVLGRMHRGKLAGIDVAIPDKHVSRRHCAIAWDTHSGWTLSDLYTVNGTTLDGAAVRGPVPIPANSEILIGTTRIKVAFDSPLGANAAGSDAAAALAARIAGLFPETALASTDDATAVISASPIGESTTFAPTATSPARPNEANSATETPAPDDAATQSMPPPKGPTTDIGSEETVPGTAIPGAVALPAATIQDVELQPGPAGVRPAWLKGIALKLVDSNLIDMNKAESLRRYARDTGHTFFRALVDDDTIRFKDEILKLVVRELELSTIDNEMALRAEVIEVEWLHYPLAETRGVLLLEPRAESVARAAVIDPFDITIDDWITRCTGQPVEKVLVAPAVLHGAINRLKVREAEDDKEEFGVAIDITTDQERQIRSQLDKADAPQVVNYFLHRGFVQTASDVHIEPTEDSMLARNRVDGILHVDATLPLALHQEVVSRIKIMSGMDVAEKRRPQDGRIGALIRGAPIDVRVSSYPTVYGEKIVMRLLDKSALRPSPEGLGLRANDLKLLKEKIGAPYGLIMISGPTGSGKTTTLYSCLGSIDKIGNNVLTIEDPVEYRLRGVHQLQVNEKIGLTFASGLRTILRQDPDVIMIGECRDKETANMAIQASLTGHIVFSTIHTNDAVGVVTRLLDMEIDPFLVANAVSLAVAQRLVRRVCRHCKTSVSGAEVLKEMRGEGVSEERLVELGVNIDPDFLYVHGAGCVHCRNTGYQGRQAVFEMFEMTREARAMIMSSNFNADELRAMAMKNGMTTVMSHGLHLVDEGESTHSEVLRVLGETY